MGQGIDIKIDMGKVEKRFNQITAHAKNHSIAMQVIATESWKHVLDHFRKEKGKDGKWAPLKNDRVMWAPGKTTPRPRGKGKLLQDTGVLRNSIQHRALKNEAHVFTNLKYARIHNFGGNIPDRHARDKKLKMFIGGKKIFTDFAKGFTMPQRQFLWMSKMVRRRLAGVLIQYISRGKI